MSTNDRSVREGMGSSLEPRVSVRDVTSVGDVTCHNVTNVINKSESVVASYRISASIFTRISFCCDGKSVIQDDKRALHCCDSHHMIILSRLTKALADPIPGQFLLPVSLVRLRLSRGSSPPLLSEA